MWLDKYKVELGYIKFNGNELKLKKLRLKIQLTLSANEGSLYLKK